MFCLTYFHFHTVGCILDDERVSLYGNVVDKGACMRFAFAAAIFGEFGEALFWLQLTRALTHLMNRIVDKSLQKAPVSVPTSEVDDASILIRITSKGKSVRGEKNALVSFGFTNFCKFMRF